MNRFQQGSLFKLKRKSCVGVWVFRWYDNTSGKRTYKKKIIGTTWPSYGIVEKRKRLS